jgi:very-short-patch-repair endonuclease
VHRFDFLVYKDNGVIYFIEYDGEQHFKPVKQWGGEAGFKERQARDEEKNQWCEKNGYELIRIPYTVQNEITIKDLRPETSPFVL